MKILVGGLASILLGLGVGMLPGLLQPARHAGALPADTDFARFSSNLIADRPKGDFDLTVEVTGGHALSGEGGAVRLFSDAHSPVAGSAEASYITAEITSGYVRVLAVEQGAMREIARAEGLTSGSGGGLPARIRLRRREPYVDVICDGRRVLRAVHDGFPGGMAGTGHCNVSLSEPMIQPIVPILFTDDFMRGVTDNNSWSCTRQSRWEVRSLDNPARSSNAFVYQGLAPKGGLSLVGRPYWDAYRTEVSVLGEKGGEVGLVLSASELGPDKALPRRFAFVRWTSAGEGEEGEEAPLQTGDVRNQGPRLEIVLVQDKKPTVLASRRGGYRPWQWYRLGAVLDDCRIRVSVDGNELLSAEHPLLSGGKTGLYVKSGSPCEFDDFRVVGVQQATATGIEYLPWQGSGGQWEKRAGEFRGVAGPGPAMAVLGRSSWDDVRIEAELTSVGSSPFGLVACFRDPGNYLAYEIDPKGGRSRLVLRNCGRERELARGPAPAGQVGPVHLVIDRGHVSAGALAAFVPDLPSGKVGVLVGSCDPEAGNKAEACFTSFSATQMLPPLPVVSINEVFDEEKLMKIWSGAGGDWIKKRPHRGFTEEFWHRAFFFGDAEMEALLPVKRDAEWVIGLSLAKPGAGKGYFVFLRQDKEGLSLKLKRNGSVVLNRTDLPSDTDARRLRFRRAGAHLITYLDDRVVLTWKDPEPIEGSGVAWASGGMTISAEAVQIYSRTHRDYSFNSAPCDWRRAGGVWQITNRWECDPRWSFMAGMPPALAKSRAALIDAKMSKKAQWTREALKSQIAVVGDQNSKLAALWHKQAFEGDFVLECFVAQMMDGKRGGGSYAKYVQNFCMTACADGKDLTTGYSFIFGADSNSRSLILRENKVVKSVPVGIPASRNIHRRWFRMRVEKKAADLQFTVYSENENRRRDEQILSMSYRDAQPLKGKRIALWTYNNGMLIARSRIASATVGGQEHPFGFYPAEANCYYTVQK